MPLTEREKQILDEIEENLYSEDPRFARQIRQPWWKKLRQAKVGAALLLGGILCLVAGFVANDLLLILGLTAFVLMLVGIVLISSATSEIAKEQVASRRSQVSDSSGSVSARLTAWQEKARDRYRKDR